MAITNSFSYLDQFQDVEINLAPYIDSVNRFSTEPYTLTNKQPIRTNMKNIFTKTNIILEFKNKYSVFEPYLLVNYDTIETIAYKYYNNIDYWWIIALFNNIKNVYTDWLLMDEQVSDIADFLFEKENKYRRDVYFNLVSELNDTRRQISVLRPMYVNELIYAFRNEVGK
jgi:hypothetical protein